MINDKFEEVPFNSLSQENRRGGRAFDNILVERLWRTVKYEEVSAVLVPR